MRSARYAGPYRVPVVPGCVRLQLSVMLRWFCAECGSDDWLVVPCDPLLALMQAIAPEEPPNMPL